MKNTIFILSTICIFTLSCKKEPSNILDSEQPEFSMNEAIWDYLLPADFNSTGLRIAEDVISPDYEVSIMDNANFGSFSSNPQEDIYFSGMTPSDITIKINNETYSPNTSGQWLNEDIFYKNYYGSRVEVTISNGTSFKKDSLYIPYPALAPRLSNGFSKEISRTGNSLSWTADANNEAEYVALVYYLYDSNGQLFDGDMVLIEDDGEFNMDSILSDLNISTIYFKLITGNTLAETFNDKKILFHISSIDHHEYYIVD